MIKSLPGNHPLGEISKSEQSQKGPDSLHITSKVRAAGVRSLRFDGMGKLLWEQVVLR